MLTSFGESHGKAVGGVLDGFPANLEIDPSFIQSELDRRRPGVEFYASSRKEEDKIEILSGIYNGRSTGAPIAFLVYNHDHRPDDYDHLTDVYRPSHADFTWQQKYGIRDPRGGGRSSARETLVRVAAGAFARILLKTRNIEVNARVTRIGEFFVGEYRTEEYRTTECRTVDHGGKPKRASGLDDPLLLDYLEQLKSAGDTTGGVIACSITGVPAGLGEPVFDKLQADLAKAMLGINAVKGFEYGSGFGAAAMKGSEHNDPFVKEGGVIKTSSNHSGGIQGGISNGGEIYFNVAFKPVSTLMMDQATVNAAGDAVTLQGRGRHDVCVVPRAVVIVEAMAALVMADHLLR